MRTRATASGTPPSVRRLAPLVPLGAATATLGYGLDKGGLPSSYLFAALLVGLAVALVLPGEVTVPAVVFGAGANTTFILAVQALRILVMVLLAPVAVRWLTAGSRVSAT